MLLDRYQPASFSEHLAWSSHGGHFFNDLLPLPYTTQTLQRVCSHIHQTQERMGRQMLLENPATYVEFAASTYSESQFIMEVVRHTGCGLLLDVNNVYVSCINHGRDINTYLGELPLAAVAEIHLAGHACDQDAKGAPLLIDSHDREIADPVWALYADTLKLIGPRPTLIERDGKLPSLSVLLQETQQAEQMLGLSAQCGLCQESRAGAA